MISNEIDVKKEIQEIDETLALLKDQSDILTVNDLNKLGFFLDNKIVRKNLSLIIDIIDLKVTKDELHEIILKYKEHYEKMEGNPNPINTLDN